MKVFFIMWPSIHIVKMTFLDFKMIWRSTLVGGRGEGQEVFFKAGRGCLKINNPWEYTWMTSPDMKKMLRLKTAFWELFTNVHLFHLLKVPHRIEGIEFLFLSSEKRGLTYLSGLNQLRIIFKYYFSSLNQWKRCSWEWFFKDLYKTLGLVWFFSKVLIAYKLNVLKYFFESTTAIFTPLLML